MSSFASRTVKKRLSICLEVYPKPAGRTNDSHPGESAVSWEPAVFVLQFKGFNPSARQPSERCQGWAVSMRALFGAITCPPQMELS